jgi:hypothetical protein
VKRLELLLRRACEVVLKLAISEVEENLTISIIAQKNRHMKRVEV